MNRFRISTASALALALLTTSGWAALPAKDSVVPVARKPSPVKKAAKPAPAPIPTPAHDEPLTEDQLAAAQRVLHGDASCEFNQTVSVQPHPSRPGLFHVMFKNQTFTMTPEPTTTGAVRLEDKRAGAMWLQIPTKSMLMNSRLGQRMVDACTHADQREFAAARRAEQGQGIGITPVMAARTGFAPPTKTNIVTTANTDGTAHPETPENGAAASTRH